MNKTKIDWCDMTWNPVTGCLHGCEYCYARKIATRFSNWGFEIGNRPIENGKGVMGGLLHELEKPYNEFGKIEPYPFKFEPTFHRYRLDEPQKVKKPQKIFVCSMADLFGDWVPDEWIQQVFEACDKAPWHKYLFLTKNPKRYTDINHGFGVPDSHNFWYGSTITKPGDGYIIRRNSFVSLEPLLAEVKDIDLFQYVDWIIIGQESGNRKDKVVPKDEWVKTIIDKGTRGNIPVFVKEPLYKRFPIKQYPKGLEV